MFSDNINTHVMGQYIMTLIDGKNNKIASSLQLGPKIKTTVAFKCVDLYHM